MPEMNQEQDSWFAPAGRASEKYLQDEKRAVASSDLIATLLNAMPDFLLVLNERRQIVAVNQRLLTVFGVSNPELLLGLRPGEALDCIHSKDGPDGCGTAKNCAVCGAVLAIMSCQNTGLPQQQECQLMLGKDCTALDLDVLATPVIIEDKLFTVLALRDISSEKRRYVMERVFFHDILNSAGGIRGLASLLQDGVSVEVEQEYKGWMVNLADNLIEEINHQRRLLDAERGNYAPVFEPVDLMELLHDVACLFENHERTPDRKIIIEESASVTLITDKPLFRRIIGNMALNALEACNRGDTVTIAVQPSPEAVKINVSNPGEIPAEIQLHLFKRSFSTKEKTGRGLGTYSMKLFGERYLGGKVYFNSADGVTVFSLELPLQKEF